MHLETLSITRSSSSEAIIYEHCHTLYSYTPSLRQPSAFLTKNSRSHPDSEDAFSSSTSRSSLSLPPSMYTFFLRRIARVCPHNQLRYFRGNTCSISMVLSNKHVKHAVSAGESQNSKFRTAAYVISYIFYSGYIISILV